MRGVAQRWRDAYERRVVEPLRLPANWHCRPTLKRRLNLALSKWEHKQLRTRLWSRPHILSIEPSNACNLSCPFCFTGAGGLGRARGAMSMALFRTLLDELGDYLILLKAYGWGEPLLCRHLDTMLAEAHGRGIFTVVNTNFSLRYDAARIERLVASGLDELVVSIDGARQGTYERYRVGGNLARVIDNVQMVVQAKQRLGSVRPAVAIEFHPFPWNTEDATAIRKLACRLDVGLRVFKGCVPGDEWGRQEPYGFCADPQPLPCHFPWTTAVIGADGGVAPCNGTFYASDDMGRLDPQALAGSRFMDVWNNDRFQLARRLFRSPRQATPAEREHVCYDCPVTKTWERWVQHRDAGADPDAFDVGITTNDGWNYFWNRRPADALRLHGDSAAPRRAAR